MMSFASWGNALYSGKKSYNFIGHRKLFFGIGTGIIIFSLAFIGIFGLQKSIDFKGGTQIIISKIPGANQGPANKAIKDSPDIKDAKVTSLGTSSVRIQTPTLSVKQARELGDKLASNYKIDKEQIATATIGPSWGSDVTNKALKSLVIFFILVGALLAAYFRTWTMSAAALYALFHDVFMTATVLAITRVEISPATIIGLLTILGYSLYDTVVVFDKVRELTIDFETQSKYTYGELVNLSINQTLVRSINTSVVALLPTACILVISSILLGGGTLRDISLALFVGTIAGTASSIFLAPAMLVILRNRGKKVNKHNEKVIKVRKKLSASGKDANELSEEELTKVAHPVVSGRHQGASAQPKRKARSKR